MLYDPVPEGAVQTSKAMQFVGAVAGKIIIQLNIISPFAKASITYYYILVAIPTTREIFS